MYALIKGNMELIANLSEKWISVSGRSVANIKEKLIEWMAQQANKLTSELWTECTISHVNSNMVSIIRVDLPLFLFFYI